MIVIIGVLSYLIIDYIISRFKLNQDIIGNKITYNICASTYRVDLEQVIGPENFPSIYVSISRGDTVIQEGPLRHYEPILKAESAYRHTCIDSVFSLYDSMSSQLLLQVDLKAL